jgi:serine/threonine protein kinase
MGTVYEVERLHDGRRLALKKLTRARSGAALSRFAREAQIAAELHHPCLVAVVDFEISSAGWPYLVMELVDGRSLADYPTPAPADWAHAVLSQIAAGLEAMHAAGILHRDLKPANVLVTDGPGGVPVVKIADFGIASLGASETNPDPLGTTASGQDQTPLTNTGALIGTPMYMAPELLRGSPATMASDIYSFGVLAYETCSGSHPVGADHVRALVGGQAPAPASPTPDRPAGIPPDLADLITTCLSSDPAARPSAPALHAAFE